MSVAKIIGDGKTQKFEAFNLFHLLYFVDNKPSLMAFCFDYFVASRVHRLVISYTASHVIIFMSHLYVSAKKQLFDDMHC